MISLCTLGDGQTGVWAVEEMVLTGGKTEILGEKSFPVPLCPPQIPHVLSRYRRRDWSMNCRGNDTDWEENRSTRRKIFPSVTLSTTNPSCTGPVSNLWHQHYVCNLNITIWLDRCGHSSILSKLSIQIRSLISGQTHKNTCQTLFVLNKVNGRERSVTGNVQWSISQYWQTGHGCSWPLDPQVPAVFFIDDKTSRGNPP